MGGRNVAPMIAKNDDWPSTAASTAAALIWTGPSGSSNVPPYPPLPGSRSKEPPPGSPLPPPNGDDIVAAISPI